MAKHVIITGFPRSGSTMFYNMLRYAMGEWTSYKFYDRETQALSVVDEPADKVTKRPMDLFELSKIREKSKDNLFVILMIRDPRSVITSIHANSEGRYKVNWDYSLRTGHKIGVCGKTPGLGEYFQEMKKIFDGFVIKSGAKFTKMKFEVVWYEALVSFPEGYQEIVRDFIGVKFVRPFRDFVKGQIPRFLTHQMNGIRPPETSRIGAWQEHQERIINQFEKFPDLFQAVRDFGYERNDEWMDVITSAKK